MVLQTSQFTGPIPPPELLAQYDQVIPGGAERILAMAEKQSAHRQALEMKAVTGDSRRSYLGLVSGTILGLAAIGFSVFAVSEGYPWVGVTAIITEISTLAGVFVYGRHRQEAERRRSRLR